jgi:hypothetical protein
MKRSLRPKQLFVVVVTNTVTVTILTYFLLRFRVNLLATKEKQKRVFVTQSPSTKRL